MDCIFCKIITRAISAEIIYEDDRTVAFLDMFPRAPGHTLVIPKKHSSHILEASPEDVAASALTIRTIAGILHASLNPAGFTIGINHGKVAGQAIDHLHAHIIPRYQGDGGTNIHHIVNNPGTQTVAQIAEIIRSKKV